MQWLYIVYFSQIKKFLSVLTSTIRTVSNGIDVSCTTLDNIISNLVEKVCDMAMYIARENFML